MNLILLRDNFKTSTLNCQIIFDVSHETFESDFHVMSSLLEISQCDFPFHIFISYLSNIGISLFWRSFIFSIWCSPINIIYLMVNWNRSPIKCNFMWENNFFEQATWILKNTSYVKEFLYFRPKIRLWICLLKFFDSLTSYLDSLPIRQLLSKSLQRNRDLEILLISYYSIIFNYATDQISI